MRQSPFLNVASEARVAATLRMMTVPLDTPLTASVARELCQRANRSFTLKTPRLVDKLTRLVERTFRNLLIESLQFDWLAMGRVTVCFGPSLFAGEHRSGIGESFGCHQSLERCEPVFINNERHRWGTDWN